MCYNFRMENSYTYKENYKIKSTDCGSNILLKPSSLLMIVQDLATLGAEYIGAGTDKVTGKGYIWVVTKMEVEIIKTPKYLEDVKLITYPNKMIHFIFPRTILIHNTNDDLMVKVSSMWCILNYENRKLVMPSDINLITPGDETMDKINPINVKETTLVEERTVRNTDLDVNMHLNNIKYLDYITDTFDLDFINNNEIKRINLVFHEEVKAGETLGIYSSEDKEYFVIKNKDKKVFECNIEFKR